MSELPSLRELLGDEAALLLIEKCGGTRIVVPQYITPTHDLRAQLGDEVFIDLVRYFGGTRLFVPIARQWRIDMYSSQKLTQAQMARKIGCAETWVQRVLRKKRENREQMALDF